MKIKLGETQKKVLFQILTDKQALQSEVQRLIQRENELVAVICESAGVQPVEGMTIEGEDLVIPDPVKAEPEKKVKKLNAK